MYKHNSYFLLNVGDCADIEANVCYVHRASIMQPDKGDIQYKENSDMSYDSIEASCKLIKIFIDNIDLKGRHIQVTGDESSKQCAQFFKTDAKLTNLIGKQNYIHFLEIGHMNKISNKMFNHNSNAVTERTPIDQSYRTKRENIFYIKFYSDIYNAFETEL